ncbi:MAG: D-Ala-D-Ala carboxypeptidase family metallohydrolase [Rikenellaceae bacterium]
MITSKHFKEVEFNRLTPSCSLQDMEQSTMDMLDKAREIAGIPFVLNCAKRTREWDLAKGRSGNSAHTEGKAVDIACRNSSTRHVIVDALLKAGFNRIGIAKTFVHADNSTKLPQRVIFLY